jgi:phosphoserine phosphatase
MKLAVFDFDSTLMDGETIDFLAEPLGLKDKVASITEMAMRGELDFFESLIMLSLIHISSPRDRQKSRMPSSA